MNVMKILVVDDESESRTLLGELLTAEGYEVRAADGGPLALVSLGVTRPDLILLDLNLPRMDGFEVLRWIRQNPDLKALRVIVLTSSDDTRDVSKAYELGANSFLVKPLHFINLPSMLQRLQAFWLQDSAAPKVQRPPRKNRDATA